MPDMDTWAMPLMMMLMMPLMFVGVFIARYNADLGIAWIFGSDFAMIPIMKASRKIAQWRAGLVSHLKTWYVQRGATLKYTGQIIYKWAEHPETLRFRVRNFRCPDGHIEPLVYITPLKLLRLFNRVTHPRYNRGGRLPAIVLVHSLPFDLQFREDLNTTSHGGYVVKVKTVSWAVLDEIMPKVVTDLMGQRRHNMLPFVDRELLHVPWYYVALSSGTGMNSNVIGSHEAKLAMQVGPKGLTVYPCLDCGKPLGAPGPDGWASCEDGHRFDMGVKK